MIVSDAGQAICWLADAKLPLDAEARTMFGVTDIDPNGSIDYATAQKRVGALNA